MNGIQVNDIMPKVLLQNRMSGYNGIRAKAAIHFKDLCMKDILKIRRENLKLLCDEAGGITKFAESIGRGQPYISQLIGINPTKPIGTVFARNVEELLSLPVGWLDQDREFNPVDERVLLDVVEATDAALKKYRIRLSTSARAKVYSALYPIFSKGHALDPRDIALIIKGTEA